MEPPPSSEISTLYRPHPHFALILPHILTLFASYSHKVLVFQQGSVLRFPDSSTLRSLLQGKMMDLCSLELLSGLLFYPEPSSPLASNYTACEPFKIQDMQLVFGLMILYLSGSFSQKQKTSVCKIWTHGKQNKFPCPQ